MVSTGLVSLNIHEPLTFEGTEIVLHPDLFSSTPDVNSSFSTTGRFGSTRLSIVPTASSEDKSASDRPLQVGDMIEVRVWDPLPRSDAQSSASSVIRRRPSPPNQPVLTTQSSMATATNEKTLPGNSLTSESSHAAASPASGDEQETLSRDASSVSSDRTQSIRNDDTQTAEEHSPQPSPVNSAGTKSGPGGEEYPVKSVSASGDLLPPVFPRSRANTSEPFPKPPIGQRRPTVTSPPPDYPSKNTRGVPNLSLAPRSRHFRDLSDMTIDTMYDRAVTALDPSSQLVDLSLQPAALQTAVSDEEDDTWATQLSHSHVERLSFVMLVTEKTLTSLKSSARTQVSLLRPVAELYQLSSYDMVTIRNIQKQDEDRALRACSADFVLFSIKDQFISRGDMHFFQNSLIGTWVYEGQRLHEKSRGIQAHAREIRHQEQHACSGIITDLTKITFRSRSARLIWLVQMSAEMWDYSSPYERDKDESICEIYFGRWIAFVHRLFAKWKEMEVTHSLTVVFFGRTFLGTGPPLIRPPRDAETTEQTDVYGRHYEDHFHIIIENETSADWDSLVVRLKEAFLNYPSEVGWNLSSGDDARRPSSASQGNVLEATNVTLNMLQFHYLDRDLHRTGNSIVVISAGNGVYEVDKGLASITYQRMIDCGIGSDMLSLALPPLHTAPFFLYVNEYQSVEEEGIDFGGTYYEVPHWMHLSFVSYDSANVDATGKRRKSKDDVLVTDIDGRPIMANGFLLPGIIDISGVREDESPGPTSFSLQGNAAASPKKKPVNQERQLIADRDFNDILEACRPRNLAVLPSSLSALLRMQHGAAEAVKEDNDFENTEEVDLVPELPEWGSLEFESGADSPMRSRRTVALGQEPAIELSPRLDPMSNPIKAVDELEKVDGLDRGSVPSSYASQYSGSLGVSYDRPFLASRASPTLTGIEVQRSPSLELPSYDGDEDDGVSSDASGSSSGVDLGTDSSVESAREVRRRKAREERYLKNIRKAMREYDSKCLVASPKFTSLGEHTFSHYGEPGILDRGNSDLNSALSSQQRPRGRSVAQGGGIGAALTQYRSTTGSSTSLQEPREGPLSASRVASGPRLAALSGSRIQMPEITARGVSPLLLPPVRMSTSPEGSYFRAGSSYRKIENRQSHQPDSSRFGPNSLGRFGSRGSSMSSRLGKSPPTTGSPISASRKVPSTHLSRQPEPSRLPGRRRSGSRNRRKKAFNPFRQQDEDEVLAKKSHNRRRWSHVFPLGEIEFKRHAGPNWKSLSSPAILPLSIDYFPSRHEIDHNYTFSIYNVTLSEFENTPYSSNEDFLMEMVRQRLTQDYQVVPRSHVDLSNFGHGLVRDGLTNRGAGTPEITTADGGAVIRQFLSMGYSLQVLTYDPSADIIEVTRYDSKIARQNSGANTFKYQYLCWCQERQRYTKVTQSFQKYADPYNWNKVDRIICGDEDREMREGMRFKRVMFGVIPEKFASLDQEKDYVDKFRRLLEYLNKLREKQESSLDSLDVKIITSADRKKHMQRGPVESTPGIARNSMQRFYVRLRKNKADPLEWMEVVVDTTCDTSWTYRIMFNWLVASSGKVDAQVQLLQRRCSQYGLNLVPFPQITVSKNVHLSPFRAPALFPITDKQKVPFVDQLLLDLDFLHDGVFYTDARSVKECLDVAPEFYFGQRWSRPTAGRQFVHRSGTLFVRVLPDLNGLAIVVTLGNYLYMSRDSKLRPVEKRVFDQLTSKMKELLEAPPASAVDAVDDSKVANQIEEQGEHEDATQAESNSKSAMGDPYSASGATMSKDLETTTDGPSTSNNDL